MMSNQIGSVLDAMQCVDQCWLADRKSSSTTIRIQMCHGVCRSELK